MGSLSLLQGIFPSQGSNPGLPHCRRILYQLSYQGSPEKAEEEGKRTKNKGNKQKWLQTRHVVTTSPDLPLEKPVCRSGSNS